MKTSAKKAAGHLHPDHSGELGRLRKVNGQIQGIEKMILSRRYCPEIVQQIRAARSALQALEVEILRGHLSACIKTSAREDAPREFEKKLEELMELVKG